MTKFLSEKMQKPSMLALGGALLMPLLNGCSPAPIYALRSLVRAATKVRRAKAH